MTPSSPSSISVPARTLRVAILVGIGFLVVRTTLVEPFGVPTGSMAPALLGNHREIPCPRCGHPVIVGEFPANERRNPYANATCDHCGRRGINLTQSVDLPGDRLLVDKNVYSVRPPRRWELAVFICPVDFSTPYVKRVVGLPGEQIQILGGDAFVNGEIVRKATRERDQMLIPVFDMAYEPERGWASRWQIESNGATRPPNERELTDGTFTLDATNGPVTLTYRNVNLDTGREDPIRDVMAYNAGTGVGRPEAVHDFAVTFDLEVVNANGSIDCVLTDGSLTAIANIHMGSGAGLSLKSGNVASENFLGDYESGSVRKMSLSYCDRRVTVNENGKDVLPPLDVPADPTTHGRRDGVSRPVQFTCHAGAVKISHVRIARDVHYRTDGANGIDAPYQLGPDEYFVLGDNSANSRDSRVWKIPGVPRANLLGKPFLIHQPMHLGRVPLNGQDRTFPTLDWSRLKWVR
jgi:signal peptidase I